MKISAWKRLAALALSASIATPSFADTESLIWRTRGGVENPNLSTTITAFKESESQEIMMALDQRLKTDSKSAVILASTGKSDSLYNTPEFQNLQNNPQVESIAATSIEDLPAQTQKSKRLKAKVVHEKLASKVKEEKLGLMVSIIPATGYGSLVLFMSGDYLTATVSFGLMFGVNAFQSIFTKQWGEFVKLGDKGMKTVAHVVGKFLGKPISRPTEERAERLGRVGWMTGISGSIAVMSMLLTGTLDSMWALLYFSYASTLDVWDKVFENKLARSIFFYKSFIAGRVAVSTILECLTLVGLQQAEIGLVGATVAGTMALMFMPTKSEDATLPSADKPRLMERFKLKVSSLAKYFGRKPAGHAIPCHAFFKPATF